MAINKTFVPNIFQIEALKEIDIAISNGDKAFAVVMPTGIGKTYLIAQWFKIELEKYPNSKLLFICHNQDILTQANDKEFANCLSNLDISRGYYNASEKNIKQLTFATVQTLSKNLNKISPDYFDYIIVDEAHHYRAKTFEKTIKYFTPKFLIGLTATPNRMDEKSILNVFGKIIYNAKISEGIKSGLLSKIRYYCVDNDIDFSDIKWNGNNYDEKDLNKKLCIPEYDASILNEYTKTIKSVHKKSKTICFCATVEHAYRMEKLFNENSIRAVALTGKYYSTTGRVTVHDNKREQIIKDFKNSNYDIIFVRDLFNEGVDIPDADSIMMLRPTQSHTIFTQQIGRGLRVSPDKDYLLVLDFTGNCHNCSIIFEALNEMMEVDIQENVRKKTDDNPQEIMIHNLGCEIRLSKKKIDIIREAEDRIVTKEKLIENYQSVKKLVSKQPIVKDMNNRRISLYSSHQYQTYFGSWNKFLGFINEPLNVDTAITKEKLIENYYTVKEKLGRQPHHSDINKSLYSLSVYRNYFGSWNKFLDSICEDIYQVIKYKNISKEKLIENYYKVKEKVGRQPSSIDINNKKNSLYSYSVYKRLFGSWNKFLLEVGEPIRNYNISKEQLINNYYTLKDKTLLIAKLFTKENNSKYSLAIYRNNFGSLKNFLKSLSNINIIPNYTPKNPLPNSSIKPISTSQSKSPHRDLSSLDNHKYIGSESKDNIRNKVISKIQNNDTILMLESPDLSALKEIESQSKHPKKIIIPNNFEFDALAESLKNYKTQLNIEAINTSALQYLVDHPEDHIDFLWLDYCGAFSYYTRDLDVVLQRKIKDMRLILTYNVTDLAKQDDSYYFTNVISYILEKLRGKNEILLMQDVSQRYKKTMYSVGFDIQPILSIKQE